MVSAQASSLLEPHLLKTREGGFTKPLGCRGQQRERGKEVLEGREEGLGAGLSSRDFGGRGSGWHGGDATTLPPAALWALVLILRRLVAGLSFSNRRI